MSRLVSLAAAVIFVCTLTTSLAARTWLIKPDGNGDAPTIQAGVTSAAAGDTLLLANGTFSGAGNRDVEVYNAQLVIGSESGNPALCIVDCGGSSSEYHQGFDIRTTGTPTTVLKDITVRNGYSSAVGAIYVGRNTADPVTATFVDCIFTGNTSVWAGGAMAVIDGCTADLTGCQFINNSATSGGALCLYQGSSATATGCGFEGNQAQYGGAVDFSYTGTASGSFTTCAFVGNGATKHGGAIYAEAGSPVLSVCTFIENSADWSGGAVYLNGGASMTHCLSIRNRASLVGSSLCCAAAQPIQITGCTFVADSLGGAVIQCGPNVSPVLDKTIIGFAKSASALACDIGAPGTPTLTCCDIYGNDFGDWTGCIAGQAGTNGNFSADPKFCDIKTANLTVETCSPCLAANNSCNQDVGALGSGCLCGQAVEPTTWGAIKAIYK